MIDQYEWSGGREAMLRFGPANSPSTGPVVVVAQPLFEEANRARALLVALLKALAAKGITGVLPDLPATGESLAPLSATSLDHWRDAFAQACDHAAYWGPVYTVAMRGGALVDGGGHALGRWHFSPVEGEALFAEMMRAIVFAEPPARRDLRLHDVPDGPPVTVFGNIVPRRLLIALQAARTGDGARTIRLDGDAAPADRHVAGTPLWRRAEPGNDPVLVQLLAEDIADWITACEG